MSVIINPGGSSIGGAISGGTDTCILFIHPANVLAQDSSFTWDTTNKVFTVSSPYSTDADLHSGINLTTTYTRSATDIVNDSYGIYSSLVVSDSFNDTGNDRSINYYGNYSALNTAGFTIGGGGSGSVESVILSCFNGFYFDSAARTADHSGEYSETMSLFYGTLTPKVIANNAGIIYSANVIGTSISVAPQITNTLSSTFSYNVYGAKYNVVPSGGSTPNSCYGGYFTAANGSVNYGVYGQGSTAAFHSNGDIRFYSDTTQKTRLLGPFPDPSAIRAGDHLQIFGGTGDGEFFSGGNVSIFGGTGGINGGTDGGSVYIYGSYGTPVGNVVLAHTGSVVKNSVIVAGTTVLGRMSIYTGSSSTKGLVIRGFLGQTSNLQEWQTAAPTTVALISSTGAGTFASVTASSLTSGRVTYASTAGLLIDSANLTFSGTVLTANAYFVQAVNNNSNFTSLDKGYDLSYSVNPGATAVTASMRALSFVASMGGSGGGSGDLSGLIASAQCGQSAGTITEVDGLSCDARNTGAGLISACKAYAGILIASSTGNITDGRVFHARTPTMSSSGVIVTNHGIVISNQSLTGMTTSYGLRIADQLAGAGTVYAISIDSTSGTTRNGIWFGGDAVLYRRAANILALDSGDSLEIPANAAIGTTIDTLNSLTLAQTVSTDITALTIKSTQTISGSISSGFPSAASFRADVNAGASTVAWVNANINRTVLALGQSGAVTNNEAGIFSALDRSVANVTNNYGGVFEAKVDTSSATGTITTNVGALITTLSHASSTKIITNNYGSKIDGSLPNSACTTSAGVYITTLTSGIASTLVNYYGVDIEAPIAIKANNETRRGIRIGSMPTPGAFTGTTIVALDFIGTGGTNRDGIRWGGDTNLYRSAADTLKTDDSLLVSKSLSAGVSTLTDGATPALDASLGNTFLLTAAGDRTIAVPTNATSGQKITIVHKASGANRTLALNTGAGGFRFGTDITGLTATTSAKTDYIGCIYNAADSFWDVVAYTKGF